MGTDTVGRYGGQSLWRFLIEEKMLSAKRKDGEGGCNGLRREKMVNPGK